MRINEIITENTNMSDDAREQTDLSNLQRLITYLKEHCRPYLNAAGGIDRALFNQPLYRGINYGTLKGLAIDWDNPFTTMDVLQNRKPKDTPVVLHHLLDDWFREKTDIPFRSQSVFCTPNSFEASIYGEVTVIVPIGEFDYCWSPEVPDLFGTLENYAHALDRSTPARVTMINELAKPEKIDELMSSYNYQYNTGLQYAIGAGVEIMISCQETVVISNYWLANMIRYRNYL